MPNFILIDPSTRTVRRATVPDYKDALREVGLESGGVDFGTLSRTDDGGSISIIVYEFGLLDDKFDSCFALGGQLYVGPAVLFQADDRGKTIDMSVGLDRVERHILWLKDKAEAEKLMQLGSILRPQNSVNGEIIWQWKYPLPTESK